MLGQELDKTVDVTQWSAEVVRYGVRECLELLVRRLELRGARVHAPLQVRVELPDLPVPLLNLAQHLVECSGKHADLVVAGALRAEREVFVLGHIPGHACKRENRLRDTALQPGGEGERNDNGAQYREKDHHRIDANAVIELLQVGLEVERP